jgi:hypothetical protein
LFTFSTVSAGLGLAETYREQSKQLDSPALKAFAYALVLSRRPPIRLQADRFSAARYYALAFPRRNACVANYRYNYLPDSPLGLSSSPPKEKCPLERAF